MNPRRPTTASALGACALLLGLNAPLLAQAPPAPPVRPTRTDVAVALMRFEDALERSAQDDAARAELNRAFDRATLAYFSGDRLGTLKQLDALTLRLLGQSEDPGARAAMRLRVALEPPVGGAAPTLRLVPLYPLPDAARPARPVRLVLQREGQPPRSIELAPELLASGSASLDFPAPEPGAHALGLELGGAPLTAGRYAWDGVDPDAARAALAARLAALPASDDAAQVSARVCAGARLELLRSRPDPEDTAQSLIDPLALRAELEQELTGLEAGRDPYRGARGASWRAFSLGGGKDGREQLVRYRVQVPGGFDPQAGGRLPVLIAFHGYQGDENMFAFAYGRGALPRLAAQQGVLLVTPRTEPFLRSPAAFERLLEELGDDYPLDRTRIWLLGHSMGAQAAALLARGHAAELAGVVLFAGGPMGGDVPTRAFLGSLDIAGGMVRRGPQVELLEGYGHTLGVGPNLGPALAWLRGLPPRKVYY